MKKMYLYIMLLTSLCVMLTGRERNSGLMSGAEKVNQIVLLKNLYYMTECQALSNRMDVCKAFAARNWSAGDIEQMRYKIRQVDSLFGSKKSCCIIKIRKDKAPQTNGVPECIAYVAKWARSRDGHPVLLALDSEGDIQELTVEPTWESLDLDTILE